MMHCWSAILRVRKAWVLLRNKPLLLLRSPRSVPHGFAASPFARSLREETFVASTVSVT